MAQKNHQHNGIIKIIKKEFFSVPISIRIVSFSLFLFICFWSPFPFFFIFVSLYLWSLWSLWSLSLLVHFVSSKLLLRRARLDLTKKSLYLSQELPLLVPCFYRLKKIWRNYQTYTVYPHFLHCFFFNPCEKVFRVASCLSSTLSI